MQNSEHQNKLNGLRATDLAVICLETANQMSFDAIVVEFGKLGAGKSCFLNRFTDNNYPYPANTLREETIKVITVGDKSIRFRLWDTLGQERIDRNVFKRMLRFADGIFLVFDTTDIDSLDFAENLIHDIREDNQNEPSVVLVGTKIDDVESRKVSEDQAKEISERYQLPYFPVSALNGTGVQEAFEALAQLLILRGPRKDNPMRTSTPIVDHTESVNRGCI